MKNKVRCHTDCHVPTTYPDSGPRQLCKRGEWYEIDLQSPWAKFFDLMDRDENHISADERSKESA